jgi:DnaA family protein
MSQLALPLTLADHAVFASFLASGNETLVATLANIARGDDSHGCWLWGAHASGKTHLLQAVCEVAGDQAAYLPMQIVAAAGPGILDGLASRNIVCIDDVDLLMGDEHWDTALFDLCNQMSDANGQLVLAAACSPREASIALPDLRSRLTRLPVFHVHALDDEQCVAALRLRSGHRGLALPDDAARYVLKRSRRDMASLYELLDRLDDAALRAQRRLTIPFIRDVLSAKAGE